MADLVWAAAQGDDDFEKALWLTVNRGSVGIPYLTAILRDPNCEISYKDRVLLAQFLDGDYINPPGRKPREYRIPYLDDTPTPAQMAAADVRAEMLERREKGLRIRGMQAQIIEEKATQYGASVETVAGILRRGRR
ncbi:hypothetical protein [Brucella anthropi]|uniref:Uncharacterized protein n=1 Tax=Brucella anthropi TaxID=529 RepID=A0A011UDC7_BRUAN|nr:MULTISPECIES: hypothetical protein [Brucella/Ochrobactrum group]EXL03908.1 hypothetical protein BG46_26310 [Brucella anthropi]KAB2734776.1 hypothetical protein F9K89_20150 [Brucella anthropi]KAB2756105.1 hypothetical protein F9K81_17770 [Brucella anthropi]KAB2769044.1 hypothetical protein F9K84_12720 [Brucella anthropi]MBE0562947.1 hypothetical protein [Brucella anthropi]